MSEDLRIHFLGAGALVDGPPPGPEVVGNKAANLMRLARLGLPIPAGFVLPTELARAWMAAGGKAPEGLRDRLASAIRQLETLTGRRFGGSRRPLLVAVRSGAPVSMPGMMDTLLDVGLNEVTRRGLLRLTGNPRLAWDCHRRLVEGLATVAHGCDPRPFRAAVDAALRAAGVSSAQELDHVALSALTAEQLSLLHSHTGRPFPEEPMDQLVLGVESVLRSWMSERAVTWRRLNGIDDDMGTAVLVQAMVFGNSGGTSGSGVGFSRNPSSGEPGLYLDFRFNAQGEDVVSGRSSGDGAGLLREALPGLYRDIERMAAVLERERGDAQDFEITVEDGKLWLLQTRNAKCTPWAALRIAVDLVREGVLPAETALERVAELDLERIERAELAVGDDTLPVATAVPAGLGVAVGRIALDPEAANRLVAAGDRAILVRDEPRTEDIAGLSAAAGLLTACGSRTAHAAVVARQLGKVCLVGCSALRIDLRRRRLWLGDRDLAEGDWLSLDGDGGRVFAGRLPSRRVRPDDALAEVARWRLELSARSA